MLLFGSTPQAQSRHPVVLDISSLGTLDLNVSILEQEARFLLNHNTSQSHQLPTVLNSHPRLRKIASRAQS